MNRVIGAAPSGVAFASITGKLPEWALWAGMVPDIVAAFKTSSMKAPDRIYG